MKKEYELLIKFICCCLIVTCIKVLLMPSYYSTDFDVHRNWLAVTYSLPLRQWYYDETSEWTLDYPPFFAYYEYMVALVVALIKPNLLQVVDKMSYSTSDVYIHRLTVITSDIVLYIATYRYLHSSGILNTVTRKRSNSNKTMTRSRSNSINNSDSDSNSNVDSSIIVTILVLFNGGLLLVDHVHFQYNGNMTYANHYTCFNNYILLGMLLGLLILSLDFANRDNKVMVTIMFSILILMKHLFIPLTPLFAIYLLSNYYHNYNKNIVILIMKISQLVAIAITSLALAFLPFILQDPANPYKQLFQIFQRLFPWGRGLLHAYWAPNIWAIYCSIDLVLSKVLKIDSNDNIHASTSGLVGDFHYRVLPSIPKSVVLLTLVVFLLPPLILIARKCDPSTLLNCAIYSTFTMFMFGYHVHEKAIIIPLILLTFTITKNINNANMFIQMSMVALYSLFPLFNGIQEKYTKILILVVFVECAYEMLHNYYNCNSNNVNTYGNAIVACVISSSIVVTEFLSSTYEKRYPFLPLLLTSLVCAIVLLKLWIQCFITLLEDLNTKSNTNKIKKS